MEGFLQQAPFAIAVFVPMLLVLVVVHELGHFLTAKAFGIKVLEFGVGYPPRAFGLYTGRTRVLIDRDTQFVNLGGPGELRSGQLVRVSSTEDANGNLVARIIELPQKGSGRKGPQSLQELGQDEYLNHEGKIREVVGGSLVLADMLYSVNYTPLGGFVRLAGENNPNVPRSLGSKGVGPRAIVLAAGAAMNAILPIVLFSIMFMVPHDVPVSDTGDLMVVGIAPGSPAESAGIQAGDIINRADGHVLERTSELSEVIQLSQGSAMDWVITRQGKTEVLNITPRLDSAQDRWIAGVSLQLTNVPVERRSEPPWTAVNMAVTNTWEMLVLLKQEVSGWIAGESAPELSGPVGIAQITGEVTREMGLQGWLLLSILFSINLAILNILPIPMLDGGRLLFVAIEWVRRGKRVPPEKEGLVHLIGFVVLIGFILLITANDIQRLIQGGSLLGG